MRLRTFAVLFLAALLSAVPTFGLSDLPVTDSTTTFPVLGQVTAYTLSNGLQVIVIPSDSADLVTVDAWVKAGTRRETVQNNGTAHFLEHLVFRSTKNRKPGEIDSDIEDIGGSLNAETSYDWAHFFVTVASSDADPALGILSDALMNASLTDQDVESERPVILNEMARVQADPESRLTQMVDQLSYTAHPYGRPLTGTRDDVQNMTRDKVVAFYNAFYAPDNITLVLSGHVTPDQGLAMAQKYLGAWPTRPVPSDSVVVDPPQTEVHAAYLVGSGTHGYMMFGFHAPAVSNEREAYTMDILLTLLGQGGNNRLDTDLKRTKKLVINISANYLTQKDPGMLTIMAEFDPGNLFAVRDGILSEVANLRNLPVSNEELSAAKHTLLADYLFDAQTTSGRANAMGFYNSIDSYQYDQNYIPNFESVTPLEVQAVAQKYLNPDAYSLVVMTPRVNPETAAVTRSRSGTVRLADSNGE